KKMTIQRKISVIVPVYNAAKYLRECLDSVAGQTLRDLEIICIDDGSTDGSLAIIEEYARQDKRIKALTKANAGYGQTLNVGLGQARGEYVGIVEPDDFIAPTMYETLWRKAAATDADFVKSDFYGFAGDGDARQIYYQQLAHRLKFYQGSLNPQETLFPQSEAICNWTGIYKKSFLDKYKIRHNETPGASYQDVGFWFQVFCRAQNICLLPQAFYFYRLDNPNSSVNSRTKIFCIQEEFAFIRRFLADDRRLEEKFLGAFHYLKFGHYLFHLHRVAAEYRADFILRMQKEYAQALADKEIDVKIFDADTWAKLKTLIQTPEKLIEQA
ncbi:glycosyl transferase group 2, partial [Candidatus Termititenax persephonae]